MENDPHWPPPIMEFSISFFEPFPYQSLASSFSELLNCECPSGGKCKEHFSVTSKQGFRHCPFKGKEYWNGIKTGYNFLDSLSDTQLKFIFTYTYLVISF